jgi:hypothetical protein
MSHKYKVFDWSKYYKNTTFRWAVVTWTKRSGSHAVCVCQQRSVARFLCAALNTKEARPTVRKTVQQRRVKLPTCYECHDRGVDCTSHVVRGSKHCEVNRLAHSSKS